MLSSRSSGERIETYPEAARRPLRLPSWSPISRIPVPRTFWTPEYIVSRLQVVVRQMRAPDEPWLTQSMCHILRQWLSPQDIVVEFGSGRSTKWFAKIVGHVVSVEHNPTWHREVVGQLMSAGLRNVAYTLATDSQRYVNAAEEALQRLGGKADLILIDGQHRGACAQWAIDRIKPGGLLVVDDVHRYVPSESRSPLARPRHVSPAKDWIRPWRTIESWRRIWTTDGTKDTAAFVAPLLD